MLLPDQGGSCGSLVSSRSILFRSHPFLTLPLVLLLGCGTPPAKPGASPPDLPLSVGQETVAPPAEQEDDPPVPDASSKPAASAAPSGERPLEVLLPVPDPAPPGGFPEVASSDKECVRSVGLTGNLARDFEALTAACGEKAGMKAYAKLATGTLGPSRPRETFSITLAGGYCYRFFAMAGGSIERLNVRVERPNGAMHSVITGKQPVVLYRPGEAWCRRRDRDFRLIVEAPAGEGPYSFGVWARPNPKGRRK